VLDQGCVVARGTHTELVDESPLYRELASAQLLV
jgi:ATP-binding cassette subfamily B protein